MDKESQSSMFGSRSSGPTLGSLEHHIMMDNRLQSWQKQEIMRNLSQEIGYAPQGSNTPLADILPRVGGGILGFLISKYFSMGVAGQVISTAAGYGVGKVISDFYNAYQQATGQQTSHMIRRL